MGTACWATRLLQQCAPSSGAVAGILWDCRKDSLSRCEKVVQEAHGNGTKWVLQKDVTEMITEKLKPVLIFSMGFLMLRKMISVIFRYFDENWDEKISIGSSEYFKQKVKTAKQLVERLAREHTDELRHQMIKMEQAELATLLSNILKKELLHIFHPN